MKSKKIKRKFDSLDELVDFYINNITLPLKKELEETKEIILFPENKDQEKARALLRNAHQKHLIWRKEAYDKVVSKLMDAKHWNNNYKDFEDLYENVEETIHNFKYVGDLTVFDVAKRIGNAIGIQPKEFVYLSRGAKQGAEILLGERIKEKRLPVEKFRKYFPSLSPIHIENILCIMKEYFIKDGIDITKEYELKIYN
ncbi:MAG: hypothetical protein J1F67_09355 [Muribaculaceae bacterium]|nr:hypothetical protein [Muribaculaceae bacterium]